MDELYQDYVEEHERFARHIEPDDNQHIFFSGKYGVGKSKFIEKFFEKYENEYYPIFLTPVDYVVSSNENIFELIKADIIRNLFQDEVLKKYQKTLIDKTAAIIKATGHNAHKIAPILIGLLNKLHPVSPFSLIDSTSLGKLVDLANEIDQDVKSSLKDVADKLDEQSLKLIEKEGTHLEFNTISELIKETIHRIKKKTVLIIDDLDRLDPDHIFRLLNILSAHHNKQSNTNKFGFDKVILIGDYNNIEFIYQHRYGEKADFKGYIDKYYSREVFWFDFDAVFRQFTLRKIGNNLPDYAKQFLDWLFMRLINLNEIRFRDVLRLLNTTPFYEKKLIYTNSNLAPNIPLIYGVRYKGKDNTINIYSENIPLVNIFELLGICFGGVDKMIIKLKNISETVNKNTIINPEINIPYLKTLATSTKFNRKNNDEFLLLNTHFDKKSNTVRRGSDSIVLYSEMIAKINWTFTGNEYSSESCYYAHSGIDITRTNSYKLEIAEFNLWDTLAEQAFELKTVLTKAGLG